MLPVTEPCGPMPGPVDSGALPVVGVSASALSPSCTTYSVIRPRVQTAKHSHKVTATSSTLAALRPCAVLPEQRPPPEQRHPPRSRSPPPPPPVRAAAASLPEARRHLGTPPKGARSLHLSPRWLASPLLVCSDASSRAAAACVGRGVSVLLPSQTKRCGRSLNRGSPCLATVRARHPFARHKGAESRLFIPTSWAIVGGSSMSKE